MSKILQIYNNFCTKTLQHILDPEDKIMLYRAWGDDSDSNTQLSASGYVEYAQKGNFYLLQFPEHALAYFNPPLGSVKSPEGNGTITNLQFSRK